MYEVNPAGNFSEYHGMAIGARAQSAKTYLEKKFTEFEDGECGLGSVGMCVLVCADGDE